MAERRLLPLKRGQPQLRNKQLWLSTKAGPVLPDLLIFRVNSKIWLLDEIFSILKASKSFKWKAIMQWHHYDDQRKQDCKVLISSLWPRLWSFLSGCISPWNRKLRQLLFCQKLFSIRNIKEKKANELHSTGKYTQYFVIACKGKRIWKSWTPAANTYFTYCFFQWCLLRSYTVDF